jgi:hypothetical protein
MSENNTQDLNEGFEVEMDDATVITVPIDDTLSNSGEAADAKAVGDALALKADASSVVSIDVNGQGADNQGHILINGTNIPMSGTDSTTLKAAIEIAAGRTGADIPVDDTVSAQKINAAIAAAGNKTAEDIPLAEGSQVTVAEKLAALTTVETENSNAITALQAKAGDTIKLRTTGAKTIAQAVDECVKTVNGEQADETGNVEVNHTLTADNLTSSQSQTSVGEWARRTSGGNASISDGSAWLSSVRGNRTHVGYVPEALAMTVTTAPREQGQEPITAEIDRDTFVAYVDNASGTYTLTYTTSWSTDPDLYGVTVNGDPISGDQITIVFTAENRGTIVQSMPKVMVSTGYNLYNHTLGYAIGLKYSETYGFRIGGTYTAVKYSSTLTGTKTTLTPVDGMFDIPANGYIWVEGGDDTSTEVYMTWADWALGRSGSWAAYTEDDIDMSVLFDGDAQEDIDPVFPYGLLRVGDVRDEIDFNTGTAISNVQRLAYSAENLATAQASGRAYEYDTNYIYLERASAITTDIEIDGDYTVSDHGLEYFTGTDIAVYAINIYGNNLKNKLERDVLTKSQDVVNNLTSTATDKALSAAQGKALNDQIGSLNSLFTVGKRWADGTKPTLTNGSHYSDGCYYWKIGCFLFLNISASFTNAPSNTTLFTLPAGYRPVGAQEICVSGGGSYNAKAQCRISDNGLVTVSSVDKWVIGSGILLLAKYN